MSRPLLVQVSYSPWSHKARLALELGGLEHDRREYISTLSEPWLRLRLGRYRGPVTVPVLLDGAQTLTDSYDIARLALEPTPWWGDEEANRQWDDWSQQVLQVGRIRTTRLVLGDDAALKASLPGPVQRLGPVGLVIGRDAGQRLLRKYALAGGHEPERAMEDLLGELDAGLAGREHLVDERLTYADLTAAVGLSFVQAPGSLPVDEASRPHWQVPALVQRYGRLLAWRDRILARSAEAAATAPRRHPQRAGDRAPGGRSR